MLTNEEKENLLKNISPLSPYKKYIQQGLSKEQAKIQIQLNNKTHYLYWLSRGYTKQDAKKEILKLHKVNKEYWINKGYTQEEAQINSKNQRKKECIFYKEYWINKGYTQEEAQINSKKAKQIKSKQLSKSFTKKQNRYCKEYWINKGYTQEEAIIKAKEENKKATSCITHQQRSTALKNFYKNLSEEDKKKKLERDKKSSQIMKAKNKTHSPIFIQYWINKGYTQEEAKIQVANTKYITNNKRIISSKIERKFLTELNELLSFKFQLNKWIRCNNHNYCPDGKYKNIIIEFNGTNFHMDNRFYDNTMKNPKGVLFNDIKQKDLDKINAYKEKNYNIFIIWEYDYINNKLQLFNILIKELENAEKNN